MFQNIAEDTVQDVKGKINTNMRIIRLFKELFKVQNIIIYVLTLFISMMAIERTFLPLGLAMVAACLGSTVPIIFVYIIALIGTGIGLGNSALIQFFWISIVYFTLIALFKPKVCIEERNEVYKTGSRLFWSYVIFSIIKNWTSDIWVSDLFYAIISASILYVFYKIFVNGIIVIKDFGIKKAFTVEEMIGATVIIALAVSIFDNTIFMGMNVTNIIVMFMIMILGWKNGNLIGATTGLATGLTICFVQGTSLSIMILLAISGVFAGILNRFGKIGVIVGFILGNIVLNYITASADLIIHFREIFVASVLLLLVPNNIKIELEDLIGRTKLLDNKGETRLNGTEAVTNKLTELQKILEETIAHSSESSDIENKKYDIFEEAFLDNLEEQKENIFYDDLISTETKVIKDIFKWIDKNDIILETDIIEIFKNNNNFILVQDENIKNDLREIVKIANRSYKIIQIENVKINENKKANKKINKVVAEVAKAVDECNKKIAQKKDEKLVKKEQEVQKILCGKNYPVEKTSIRRVKNGKYIVEIKLAVKDDSLREKSKIANIADLISKTIGSRVSFQKDRKNLENGEYAQTYSSEDKFIMQVGSSKISKDDSKASGDSNLQMRLDDGKYILAISDGMGTGALARENSKSVVKKLKSLLQNGFEKETTIELINGSLSLKAEGDEYATLDMCILDLYEGNLSLIKNGACNTYIKNKNNISIIQSDEMPIGVNLDLNLKEKILPVADGDIILMCSDGLLDSKDEIKKDWVEEFLRNLNTNNVQKISDMILAEAIDNNYGIAGDDITVIVAKIIKKK